MKRICYLVLFISLFCQYGHSQAIGDWQTFLSYYNTVKVAETNNYVFAIAQGAKTSASDTELNGGSLFRYSKEDNSIKLFSRQDGLNDQQITHIGFNSDTNTLLIVYKDGNIDLLVDNSFSNIPYLYNSSIKDKTINEIYFYNEYAYLSGNFGIMVLNVKKKEITDTYQINKTVTSCCIKDNYLYAATENGLYRGLLTSNLLDINNWQSFSTSASSTIEQLTVFENQLCFKLKNGGTYYQDESGNIHTIVEGGNISKMKLVNNKLVSFTTSTAYISSSLTEKDVVNVGTINDISSLKDENTFWIAAGNQSLKGIKKNSDQYTVIFSDTIAANSGPKRNLCDYMKVNNQRLFVAGGGRGANRYDNFGTFMIYDNNAWKNYDEDAIKQKAGIRFSDVMSIAIDPKDNNHYYASTWGEGVFEFKDDAFVQLYNSSNSPLESAVANSLNFIRIEGLCFDKDNNLWMTNSEVSSALKVLKNDGTWASLAYSDLSKVNSIDKILITKKNIKWINILRSTPGIFVLNDNETIDDTSDDTYRLYQTLISSADGKNMTTNGFYCLTEDKNGAIYIGTGNGLAICTNPSSVPTSENLVINRPTREATDGSLSYFLDGEQINAIAVDGGNRKWIGTQNSGVFLISEDASETIKNFTTSNSPILSNTVVSLAIDPVNGRVYIGTDKGITSYLSDATEGKENYSNVYAYPNPVRPEDIDQVTIAGLMENSNVKITDLSGNLIYQGKSVGGQLTWNCRNHSGSRVATGIYLVLAATQDSKESVVTKIMIVK